MGGNLREGGIVNNMPEVAQQIFEEADCLFTRVQVDRAISEIALALNERLVNETPVVLCVMNGGVIATGMLLPKLRFQLELDYLHATRYGDETTGGKLLWKHHHEISLLDRTVIIIDDILDEGTTLKAIIDACERERAREVISVVLTKKIHNRNPGIEADYVGLEVPDRYVFGFGMDYCGFLRNAPGIYAVRGK